MQGTLLVFTRAGAPARRIELNVPRVLFAGLCVFGAVGALGLLGWECGRLLASAL